MFIEYQYSLVWCIPHFKGVCFLTLAVNRSVSKWLSLSLFPAERLVSLTDKETCWWRSESRSAPSLTPNNELQRDGSRQPPSWKCHGQHQRPGSLLFHSLNPQSLLSSPEQHTYSAAQVLTILMRARPVGYERGERYGEVGGWVGGLKERRDHLWTPKERDRRMRDEDE